jgi:hypothetical protein
VFILIVAPENLALHFKDGSICEDHASSKVYAQTCDGVQHCTSCWVLASLVVVVAALEGMQ